MDFVIGLLISINWKNKNYDFLLIIINYLIKIVYYKSIKVTINTLGQTKVIINMKIRHYSILKSIVINQSLLFISKFWFLLCY